MLRDFFNIFYLPKELISKAFGALLISIVDSLALVFGSSFICDELWKIILWVPILIIVAPFPGIIPFVIFDKREEDFFIYIHLIFGIKLSACTIGLYILLQSYPIWILIICLIISIGIWCFFMYSTIYEKIKKRLLIKLLQIDRCIYSEFDGYASLSYNKHRIGEFICLPVGNDDFAPYCKFGDLLCILKCAQEYNNDILDVDKLHHVRYIIEDTNGNYHYAEKILTMHIMGRGYIYKLDVRPDMELSRINIKNLYEITDKISNHPFINKI